MIDDASALQRTRQHRDPPVERSRAHDHRLAFERPRKQRPQREKTCVPERLFYPAEIAALAVYLASDESAFTTGTAQVIDGGWSN